MNYLKQHPTLAVNLRQLNVIDHIRFSDRWLADLQPGEPPRFAYHGQKGQSDLRYYTGRAGVY